MTAIYVRNGLPTKAIAGGETPYERWFRRKPSYRNLHVWGCQADVQIPKETRKKLDKTARKCMFVGYRSTAQQYRLYDPVERRFLLSPDVVFEESTSYYPLKGFDNSPAQPYYAPATHLWEEQLA